MTTDTYFPDNHSNPSETAGAANGATATLPTGAVPTSTVPPIPAGPVPMAAPAPSYYTQAKTNVLGIVTLVLGVLGFGLVPVITGHIALSQIKKTGEDGRGITLAGLILGYVTLGGWLIVAAFWIAVAGFAAVGALFSGAWVN